MIKLVTQNFYKELSTAPVNWLLANVGDKLRIETTFKVENYAVSSIENPFIINNTDGTIGVGWVFDPQGQFKNFKIGNTLRYFIKGGGATATITIIDKLDDYNIQLSAVLSEPNDFLATDWIFSVTNAITGMKYRWNFIENLETDNFVSKVSGTEHLLINEEVDASDVTVLDMEFFGAIESRIGSATIQGVSIDDGSTSGVYSNTFKIIHYTYLTPFILSAELDGEGNPTIVPPYFKNGNCLKFITGIEALYEFTDPNGAVVGVLSDTLGETGWGDENFNGGSTNYSFDVLQYRDLDSQIIPGLQLSANKTTVHFEILNTVDDPFGANTKVVVNIVKAPFAETEYQNNGKTLDDNFLFDRAIQQAGIAAVNGDQFGTGRQIISNLTVTLGSAETITVEFDVELGVDVLADLNASLTPSYRLFVSVQNDTIATKDADLVTLFIDDYNQFYINNTDDDMITDICTTFIRHPEGDPDTEGVNQCPIPGNSSAASISLISYNSDILTGDFGYADDGVGTNYIPVATFTTPLPYLLPNQATLDAWIATLTILSGWTIQGIRYSNGLCDFTLYSPTANATNYNTKSTYETFVANSLNNHFFAGGVDDIPAGVLGVYPEDEIVACTKFSLDRNGRETDDIVLTSVQNKIVARNTSTLEYFELDGCTVGTAFYPLVGAAQYMNAQMARNFHVPVGTIRKYIQLSRRTDLDGGGLYVYQMNFPLLFRWEYWAKLVGANSDFFNTSLPNNGFNHWWYHYKTGNWKIYNKLIVNATKNGIAQQYISYSEIVPHDYSSNADWTTKNIKTYTADGSVELYDSGSGKRFINGFENTLVKANFTKNVTPGNVTVEIKIEVWEQGGYYGLRVYSSRWVADSDTWFTSTDGSGKVVLTPTGDSIEAKCLIDFSLIPNVVSFKLSARIYDGSFGLTTDDDVPIATDDGVFITVD